MRQRSLAMSTRSASEASSGKVASLVIHDSHHPPRLESQAYQKLSRPESPQLRDSVKLEVTGACDHAACNSGGVSSDAEFVHCEGAGRSWYAPVGSREGPIWVDSARNGAAVRRRSGFGSSVKLRERPGSGRKAAAAHTGSIAALTVLGAQTRPKRDEAVRLAGPGQARIPRDGRLLHQHQHLALVPPLDRDLGRDQFSEREISQPLAGQNRFGDVRRQPGEPQNPVDVA
jgi:hypothetical protein